MAKWPMAKVPTLGMGIAKKGNDFPDIFKKGSDQPISDIFRHIQTNSDTDRSADHFLFWKYPENHFLFGDTRSTKILHFENFVGGISPKKEMIFWIFPKKKIIGRSIT